MSKPWVLAGLLGLWLTAAQAGDVPVLFAAGLHVVDMQGTEARWLGPGGHPAWTVDGKALYVEAAHGALDGPPLGPVYQVEARIGAAQGLLAESPMGCVKVSSTGKFLAWLSVPADSTDAFVAVYTSGLKPVGPPHRLGPLTSARRDAYAWLPGTDVLVYLLSAEADGDEPGIWQLDAATEELKRVAQGAGGDGLPRRRL
ncbi:MAG: hypothetical protein HYU66_16140, partial [Armatimonadetes bacterium]|nr:hypothetical protein [Armatimonadota bacterium]